MFLSRNAFFHVIFHPAFERYILNDIPRVTRLQRERNYYENESQQLIIVTRLGRAFRSINFLSLLNYFPRMRTEIFHENFALIT